MFEALKRHVRLLEDYYTKAFVEGNQDYLGEVAAKLRLLVTGQGKTGRPLLIGLIKELGLDIRLTLDHPPFRRRE